MERHEIHNRITELMFGTTAPTGQIWTAIHEIEHEDAARVAALESESAQYREAAEKADAEVERLRKHADFYLNRCNLLVKNQHRMRDPERTLVCDVLANGQLLPDPDGKRYGSAALAAGKG